jgi:hypothetical protein
MHLDGDPHVRGASARVDVLPEWDRDLVPLVVARVEIGAVPGQDAPGRKGPSGVRARHAGHRDDPLHAEQRGDLDRIAQIVRVLLADLRIGVKRVAVAVQRGQRDAGGREQAELLRWRIENANRGRDSNPRPSGYEMISGCFC